jgi:hypothetical protein
MIVTRWPLRGSVLQGPAVGSTGLTKVGAQFQVSRPTLLRPTIVTFPADLGGSVGVAAGDDTATAVATWLQSGVGSAAGSNTSTAVGQAIFNGVGSAAGSNTATALAKRIQWDRVVCWNQYSDGDWCLAAIWRRIECRNQYSNRYSNLDSVRGRFGCRQQYSFRSRGKASGRARFSGWC